MSDAIITVEGLGKRYRLGASRSNERYTALRDVVAEAAAKPFRALTRSLSGRFQLKNDARSQALNSNPSTSTGAVGSPSTAPNGASDSALNLNPATSTRPSNDEEFWALKNVSFEVRQGEVLGIIGRNGAGKSTLLKILSRITEPTEGRIKIKGRVASLLEVGTGFHPELTGRENIYLNGAILGMHRSEIKAKFDEIVAFAEVEKFLDTPVKRYSSGMYVRLAFAVAAHLEPEILVVDEVLAVGDAEFQKKCLGKMHEVARGGRTVLFVSHNMTAIQTLCTRGVLLQRGVVKRVAGTAEVVDAYLATSAATTRYVARNTGSASGNPHIAAVDLTQPRLTCNDVTLCAAVSIVSPRAQRAALDVRLKDRLHAPVAFGSLGTLNEMNLLHLSEGETTVQLTIAIDTLASGSYLLSFDLTNPFVEIFDRAEDCVAFDVEQSAVGLGRRAIDQRWGYGSCCVNVARFVQR
ncbi:MAG: ABC transporter ATP-binding protein [Chthoniobacterales bacterium]